MSVMPLLSPKPHWLSGRCSSVMVGTSLSRSLASTLPVMENIDSLVIGAVRLFTFGLV